MKFDVRMAALSAGATLFACLSTAALAARPAAAAPKKIAILIFPGVQIIDYSGPFEAFSDAGYDVFAVGATRDPVTTAAGDGEKITPKYTFADAPQADLVVIPGGDYEAPAGSPAVAWIKRESDGAGHVMSVCNGAFTLANTGLLDGLTATTTAGNIARLSRDYRKIRVVNNVRVVDNGKILTTAGLSAGIDGALHMIEVMDSHDRAQSTALTMEYDWRPEGSYVRGLMADRMNPRPSADGFGEFKDFLVKGDGTHWETTRWFETRQSAADFFAAVKTAYEKAYAADGPWAPGSVRTASLGPLASEWRFDDRDGGHWRMALTVEPTTNDPHQFTIQMVTDRIG
jgi:putative intracellular protease/amidase